MLVQVKTTEQLKQEFIISLRNNCGDKITKVTPLSVTNGFAFGLAKIVQKINKDSAMIEAKLFPENANSTILDSIASREGIPGRRSSSKSSVVLLFRGTSGTTYPAGLQVRSVDGVIFELKAELVLGTHRFGYMIAESTTFGISTNVSPNSITETVATPPVGHTSVTNPYRAVGGRDEETDYDFRNRLLQAENIISRNTEAYYEALLYTANEDVLRVHSRGLKSFDDTFEIIVVKNSLADFSAGELSDMKTAILNSIPLSDYGTAKISVANISWTYVDIVVPLKLKSGYTLDQVLPEMQILVSNFVDISKWQFGEKLQWDDLLEVCKKTTGVEEVYDDLFTPNSDVLIPEHSLPRIRNFAVRDVVTNTTLGEVTTPSFWTAGNLFRNYFVEILEQTLV